MIRQFAWGKINGHGVIRDVESRMYAKAFLFRGDAVTSFVFIDRNGEIRLSKFQNMFRKTIVPYMSNQDDIFWHQPIDDDYTHYFTVSRNDLSFTEVRTNRKTMVSKTVFRAECAAFQERLFFKKLDEMLPANQSQLDKKNKDKKI